MEALTPDRLQPWLHSLNHTLQVGGRRWVPGLDNLKVMALKALIPWSSHRPACNSSRQRRMPYLLTQWSPTCALWLLVTFGQGPVAGAQPLTWSIIYLHSDPLGGPFLRKGLQVCRFFVSQEVFKPSEQFWEFPEKLGKKNITNNPPSAEGCFNHLPPTFKYELQLTHKPF